MADVHIPTVKEIHIIAYVTMRGWRLDGGCNLWRKTGQLRKLTSYELESFQLAGADGWYDYENDPELWRLNDAYYHELGLEEAENGQKDR